MTRQQQNARINVTDGEWPSVPVRCTRVGALPTTSGRWSEPNLARRGRPGRRDPSRSRRAGPRARDVARGSPIERSSRAFPTDLTVATTNGPALTGRPTPPVRPSPGIRGPQEAVAPSP